MAFVGLDMFGVSRSKATKMLGMTFDKIDLRVVLALRTVATIGTYLPVSGWFWGHCISMYM